MSWAKNYINSLQRGETISFCPKGNSMSPKINSGDLITLSPDVNNLAVDDVVLCKVKGRFFVHLIKATKIEAEKTLYLIGNNKGHINGWIGINAIFGKVINN